MRPDPRKRFTDTITSLKDARQLAPDDSGERAPPNAPSAVTQERYESDMDAILEALNLLKQFQDRTAWSLKLLAILFTGACGLATIYGALRHG